MSVATTNRTPEIVSNYNAAASHPLAGEISKWLEGRPSPPGEFKIVDGEIVYELHDDSEPEDDTPLAERIIDRTMSVLNDGHTLSGLIVDILTSDYKLLETDLVMVDHMTRIGAPLYQELETLEALAAQVNNSGGTEGLANYATGNEHSAAALTFIGQFMLFTMQNGMISENLNLDIYGKAFNALKKIANGEKPSYEEAVAFRSVLTDAKVHVERYSYTNLAKLLESVSGDRDRIQAELGQVS